VFKQDAIKRQEAENMQPQAQGPAKKKSKVGMTHNKTIETIETELARTEKVLQMVQIASADVQQRHKQQQVGTTGKAVDEAVAAKVTIIEQMDVNAERQKAAEEQQ
jgi:hypothetical protein